MTTTRFGRPMPPVLRRRRSRRRAAAAPGLAGRLGRRHPPRSSASVRTGGGPPQQPCARSVRYLDVGTWHTPVSGRTSCTLSAAVQIAGDGRRDRPRLLIAGEQQEGRRPPVALDADRVEVRLRMGELAIAMRLRPSRRNEGSDRSAGPGPSRFRARDPARGAARGSWSRSGRCPVATTIRSTGPSRRGPSAVSPASPIRPSTASTAVAANPRTRLIAPRSTSSLQPPAERAAGGQFVGKAAAIDAHETGAAHHPGDRGPGRHGRRAGPDRAAHWRPNSRRRPPRCAARHRRPGRARARRACRRRSGPACFRSPGGHAARRRR